MKINTESAIKAGGIGAAIAAVIGLLSGVVGYFISGNFSVGATFCCGGVIIPLLSGVLYGYLTPGKETLGQGALGGALSGFAAGIMYGIFQGISTAVVFLVQGSEFSTAIRGSIDTIVGYCCAAIFVGSVMGAIGGAVWVVTQGNKGA